METVGSYIPGHTGRQTYVTVLRSEIGPVCVCYYCIKAPLVALVPVSYLHTSSLEVETHREKDDEMVPKSRHPLEFSKQSCVVPCGGGTLQRK